MAAARAYPVLSWLLVALFALRVLGQAIQRWFPQSSLPDFGAFQGSGLPYGLLLPVQFAILALMMCFAYLVQKQRLQRSARFGRLLLWLGWIYMAGSLARIAIGVAVAPAPPWFRTWIPASFHLVLAAYVLTLAYYHRQRP